MLKDCDLPSEKYHDGWLGTALEVGSKILQGIEFQKWPNNSNLRQLSNWINNVKNPGWIEIISDITGKKN